MRLRLSRRAFAPAFVVLVFVAMAGWGQADESESPSVAALAARAERAGLRVLGGEHLTLVTDRPAREGDGVDELPGVFDAAWAAWCAHYGIDPDRHRGWRAFGCLIVDRERFRTAGLLPDTIPAFTNGHCHADRFWLADQSNPDYRRHLLLHEGVHAFTLTLRQLDAPTWYMEGIAEYLATHRLDVADGRRRFVATPMPARSADVEQLGRIERIRFLRTTNECPGLDDVFATTSAEHRDLSDDAASWAAVALLARHPRHAAAFAAAERGPLDPQFTRRLTASFGWDAAVAGRDFDAFTDELDYGYDAIRSAIDWSSGRPLTMRQPVAVAGDRGWQNTGWSLGRGRRYAFTTEGRCVVGLLVAEAGEAGTTAGARAGAPADAPRRLESTADGISLRWYRGRPLGRLLVAQWMEEPPGGGRPRFEVLAAGAGAAFTAAVDGPVFVKINEPPGELADNAGRLEVTIAPAE
jgi:hypothetical protein